MRMWIDLTNSPHVLVMRPLIEVMRADGHEVEVTARDFAQTLELCERFVAAIAREKRIRKLGVGRRRERVELQSTTGFHKRFGRPICHGI